jgi:serine protease Do
MHMTRYALLILFPLLLLPACKKKEGALFYESGRAGTAEAPVKEVPKDILTTQQAFINVARTVNPAVVNISTESRKKVTPPFFEFSPFFDDFFGENSRPQYRREKSLGSGFILNKDGYIITNDHVVREADTIQVKLADDRVFPGRVIGSDPKTDLAIVKINARGDLPSVILGDSDKLQVGQWAVAIGNPFGLAKTVTVGVISATGRSNMGIETYEDFIQTDASINPGNSGGPLLNVFGEVVGINTAIVAAGQGIGFAIPVNMAKQVAAQLMRSGKVARGWLGVTIQPVTEELARSFGLKRSAGALVSDVISGSPAAQAGIRQGDVITRFDGKELKDSRQLQLMVAETAAGKKVEIELYREGKPLRLTLPIGSADSAGALRPRAQSPPATWLGMKVEELPRELRMRGATGVVVAGLEDGGVAAEGGIRKGDIIQSINQRRITGVSDFTKAMKDAEKLGAVALLVKRGGTSLYFAFTL